MPPHRVALLLSRGAGLFVVSIAASLAQAPAAPSLEPGEEIVKTKDGCGIVVRPSVSGPFFSQALANVTWGGACVGGLAMGEGVVANGMAMAGQPTMLPTRGRAWHGRLVGATETRWDSGLVSRAFNWDGRTAFHRSIDSGPVWGQGVFASSVVSDGETMVMAFMSGGKASVSVASVSNPTSNQQQPCPSGSARGCEVLWEKLAGPVIARMRAFMAENEPKARARINEAETLATQWRSRAGSTEVARLEAEAERATSGALDESRSAASAHQLNMECLGKDTQATAAFNNDKGPFSEKTERLGKALKALYEGPCAKHPGAARGKARADELLRNATRYRQEEKQQAAAEARQREEDARARSKALGTVAAAAAAAAGGKDGRDRAQRALESLSKPEGGEQPGSSRGTAGEPAPGGVPGSSGRSGGLAAASVGASRSLVTPKGYEFLEPIEVFVGFSWRHRSQGTGSNRQFIPIPGVENFSSMRMSPGRTIEEADQIKDWHYGGGGYVPKHKILRCSEPVGKVALGWVAWVHLFDWWPEEGGFPRESASLVCGGATLEEAIAAAYDNALMGYREGAGGMPRSFNLEAGVSARPYFKARGGSWNVLLPFGMICKMPQRASQSQGSGFAPPMTAVGKDFARWIAQAPVFSRGGWNYGCYKVAHTRDESLKDRPPVFEVRGSS